MANQKTLILCKPDAVQRRLVGEIVSRFENKGFTVEQMKLMTLDRETAAKHYAEHDGKPFFDSLLDFITSGPIVAMCISGDEAIAVCRLMMGATKFTEAAPGTIRGDFAHSFTENLVHGSDSPESAARELALFFDG
ncbi:MAG: nucleoside-diphosphate kinase [Planctomycetota bacterium]